MKRRGFGSKVEFNVRVRTGKVRAELRTRDRRFSPNGGKGSNQGVYRAGQKASRSRDKSRRSAERGRAKGGRICHLSPIMLASYESAGDRHTWMEMPWRFHVYTLKRASFRRKIPVKNSSDPDQGDEGDQRTDRTQPQTLFAARKSRERLPRPSLTNLSKKPQA